MPLNACVSREAAIKVWTGKCAQAPASNGLTQLATDDNIDDDDHDNAFENDDSAENYTCKEGYVCGHEKHGEGDESHARRTA